MCRQKPMRGRLSAGQGLHIRAAVRAGNSNTSRHLVEFWMIQLEIAFADLSDNEALAEASLKYTFAALLDERQEDLAFFDQRIENGLVGKLEGIVGSEFVHMD